VSKSMRRIFSTPTRAATKIGDGTDLSVRMIAWGRNKLDPASPRTSPLECDLGNALLPRLGARLTFLRTHFVADRPHPTAGTTLPGMAGWRGFQSPALDAVLFLIQNEWTVKQNMISPVLKSATKCGSVFVLDQCAFNSTG